METAIARKRLEEMCGELDRSIGVLQGERTANNSGSDSPQDLADAGAALSDTDRTESVLATVQSQRTQVMDALSRIELGTYGRCSDCDSLIPEGRLDARPEAARCVSCQSKRDRR